MTKLLLVSALIFCCYGCQTQNDQRYEKLQNELQRTGDEIMLRYDAYMNSQPVTSVYVVDPR